MLFDARESRGYSSCITVIDRQSFSDVISSPSALSRSVTSPNSSLNDDFIA